MKKSIFSRICTLCIVLLCFTQTVSAAVPNPPESLPAAPTNAPGDVLSIYSGYYDNATAISGFSGSGDKKEISQVIGDDMVYIENGLNTWSYVNFTSPLDVNNFSSIHLDVYVVSGDFNLKISFADRSSNFSIPVVEGWNRLQLELNDYKAMFNPPNFEAVSFIAFINDEGYKRSIFVDNIYVSNAENPEQLLLPALPVAAPTHAANYVLPIFSESYSTNVGFNIHLDTPGSPKKFKGKYYSPSTEIEKMFWINAGMNNGGGGFLFNSIQDVSAYDYLHVDLFLAGTNTLPLRFRFGVITTTFKATYAPNPSATVFTAQPGWNSINIKLSDFLALAANSFDLTTMNGIGLWHKTGGTRTVYIDNIYFYKVPTQYRAKASGLWIDFGTWQKWDGTAWADAVAGQIPNSASTITIDNAEVTIDVPITVENLTIGSEGKLTLAEGKTLAVSGDFNINVDSENNSGTFVDANPAGGLTIAGQANVQQYLEGGRNWYIASPVANASAGVITSGKTGNAVYEYDEVNNNWPTATTFESGKGYVASIASANSGIYTFTGTEINQGAQLVNIERTALAEKPGFHLLGNPYPSYYNIRTTINETAGLDKTAWYRVRNSGNTAYFFDTYNAVSNLGTNNNGRGNVSGILPPFQSVWVRVSPGVESVAFDYSQLLTSHKTETANPLRVKDIEGQRVVRLSVSNQISEDETIVYFNNKANTGFDNYDSPKMSNSSSSIPEIQTKAGNEYLAINGINESALYEEIPLYFKTAKAGTFRIRAKEIVNFGDLSLVLIDKVSNKEQVLRIGGAYHFDSQITHGSDRFAIKVKSMTTDAMHTEIPTVFDVKALTYGSIVVRHNDFKSLNACLCLYSSTGQLIEKIVMSNMQTVIEGLQQGIYILRINSNGVNLSQTVVVR